MSHAPSAVSSMLLITKREMGQYFRTWSGYIVSAAMLLVTALLYNAVSVGSSARYSSDVLASFFENCSGTTIVAGLLFAMRLIAEERQTGTYPLIATSSLTDGQIIFAKYLSAMVLLSIYIALTIPMPLLVLKNGSVTAGHIACGYLGLLCIGSASVSIGLFGSSLFKSQLVAAIVAGVITVMLLLLWLTARIVDGPLGDIISYLALHDKHFRPFMDGTIALSGIVFYVSLSAFFLVMSRFVLEGQRWRS